MDPPDPFQQIARKGSWGKFVPEKAQFFLTSNYDRRDDLADRGWSSGRSRKTFSYRADSVERRRDAVEISPRRKNSSSAVDISLRKRNNGSTILFTKTSMCLARLHKKKVLQTTQHFARCKCSVGLSEDMQLSELPTRCSIASDALLDEAELAEARGVLAEVECARQDAKGKSASGKHIFNACLAAETNAESFAPSVGLQ